MSRPAGCRQSQPQRRTLTGAAGTPQHPPDSRPSELVGPSEQRFTSGGCEMIISKVTWLGVLLAGALATTILSLGPTAEAGKKDDTLVWATDRDNPIADPFYLNTRELVVI